MPWYFHDDWPQPISAAERRRRAARRLTKLQKAGRVISPVEISGRKISATFWGDAWCRNLEAYSDYSNRLPRGRSYVRDGSVIDLQIEAGRVHALVSGSDVYEVEIKIKPLANRRWSAIRRQCAGQIESLLELLRGRISRGVMEVVTRKKEGVFPSPREISLSCSCPDWASMCKHVAAALYGVGARLDQAPELLFTLRCVDPTEMVEAALEQPLPGKKSGRGRVLETDDLSSVFGVDIDTDKAPTKKTSANRSKEKKRRTTKKPAGKQGGCSKRGRRHASR
jgi:uncharacterized Zn finger protein